MTPGYIRAVLLSQSLHLASLSSIKRLVHLLTEKSYASALSQSSPYRHNSRDYIMFLKWAISPLHISLFQRCVHYLPLEVQSISCVTETFLMKRSRYTIYRLGHISYRAEERCFDCRNFPPLLDQYMQRGGLLSEVETFSPDRAAFVHNFIVSLLRLKIHIGSR